MFEIILNCVTNPELQSSCTGVASITQANILDVVSVAGFCFISSLISPAYVLLPVLLAICFPAYQIQAAFIGMVSVFFMGAFSKIMNGMRGK